MAEVVTKTISGFYKLSGLASVLNNLDYDDQLSCRSNFTINHQITPKKISPEQDYLCDVIEKILKRGNPTLAPLSLERYLKDNYPDLGIIKQANDSIEYIARPKNCQLVSQIREFSKTGFYHPISNYSINYELAETPSEKKFLEKIKEETNELTASCFLPQVKICALAARAERRFARQRVDFALRSPRGLKIVVEIDGDDHVRGKAQKDLDYERNEFLKKSGWHVFRIKNEEVSTRYKEVINALKGDPLLNLSTREYSSGCKHIANFGYGVWRVHAALLEALKLGLLKINKEVWNIRFVEVESSYPGIALHSFVSLLKKLSILYELPLALKEVKYTPAYKETLTKTKSISIKQDPQLLPEVVIDNSFNNEAPFRLTGKTIAIRQELEIAENDSQIECRSVDQRHLSTISNKQIDCLKFFLQYLFRKTEFREGQQETISRILQGENVVSLLPTGAGKSLCYQLTSLLQPGGTLVVDPIISLMTDQEENLSELRINTAKMLSSALNEVEMRSALEDFSNGRLTFLFISPERFQNTAFRKRLKTLTYPINQIVIDEAHCVSEWGHDFRPAYLSLRQTIRKFCSKGGFQQPIIALTGTASTVVLDDICRVLEIEDYSSIITPSTFDRKELHLKVIKVNEVKGQSDQLDNEYKTDKDLKAEALKRIMTYTLPKIYGENYLVPNGKNTYSGIIFCPFVNGTSGVNEVAKQVVKTIAGSQSVGGKMELLVTKNNTKKKYEYNPFHQEILRLYSGKTPYDFGKGDDAWMNYKKKSQKLFKQNKSPLLVATKSFGMGIDKPNIRFVIHYTVPPSIEAYYQEVGRAGRDRKNAYCMVLFDEYSDKKDVSWFHEQNFIGKEKEISLARSLYKKIKSVSDRGNGKTRHNKVLVAFDCLKPNLVDRYKYTPSEILVEKIIYRLMVIGFIEDYTKDYKFRKYECLLNSSLDRGKIINNLLGYQQRYNPHIHKNELVDKFKAIKNQIRSLDDIEIALQLIIGFVYEKIAGGRKQATDNILDACQDKNFKKAILLHLEKNQFTDKFKSLRFKEGNYLKKWVSLIREIRTPQERKEAFGAGSRLLEDYPHHPGLRLIVSLVKAGLGRFSTEEIKSDFQHFKEFLSKHASAEQSLIAEKITDSIIDFKATIKVGGDKNSIDSMVIELMQDSATRCVARKVLEKFEVNPHVVGQELQETALFHLLDNINHRVDYPKNTKMPITVGRTT